MTYEIYRYIFFGGAALSGLMLIATVLIFFFLRIPTVIGDLSGATAKKAIENIRNQNTSSGEKTYKSSYVNRERGKVTDKITSSGRLIKEPSELLTGAMSTEKISTQSLADSAADETTVLGQSDTALNETTVLSQPEFTSGETTVLDCEVQTGVFEIEFDITYIHTDEVIG